MKVQVDVSKKDWFIPDVNKKWTVHHWLDVHGPSQFNLKPGESKKVKLTISCPKEIVGEVVGMVSFLYQGEQKSMVTPMISVSMYVIAKGSEKMGGEKDQENDRPEMEAAPTRPFRRWSRTLGMFILRPSGRLVVSPDAKVEPSWPAWRLPKGLPLILEQKIFTAAKSRRPRRFHRDQYKVSADLSVSGFEISEKPRVHDFARRARSKMSPIWAQMKRFALSVLLTATWILYQANRGPAWAFTSIQVQTDDGLRDGIDGNCDDKCRSYHSDHAVFLASAFFGKNVVIPVQVTNAYGPLTPAGVNAFIVYQLSNGSVLLTQNPVPISINLVQDALNPNVVDGSAIIPVSDLQAIQNGGQLEYILLAKLVTGAGALYNNGGAAASAYDPSSGAPLPNPLITSIVTQWCSPGKPGRFRGQRA